MAYKAGIGLPWLLRGPVLPRRCGSSLSNDMEGVVRTFTTTPSLKLHQFQKKKILTEFSVLYDRNRDQYIDGEDMDAYKKRLYDYYAQTRGQNLTKYPTGYNDYWTLFREVADENDDGKLSKQEWLDVWSQINDNAREKSFKGLPQWVRLMPYVIFPIMDYKDDGYLDDDEYKTFWYEVGGVKANSSFIHHCLNVMTENGKYKLNMQRFQVLYADFYFSTSTSTPGRYMAGPIEYD